MAIQQATLNKLLQQAQEKVDEAAKQLAQHIGQRQASQDKLKMLQSYRDEYQQRLDNSSRQGVAPHELLNFREFINKLELALTQQENEVAYWEKSVQASQQMWLAEQRKLKSFDVLGQRQHELAQQKQDKLLQKQNDEFSMNQYFRKQSHE
ncbi:flagellar export protein FliJ [Parvibium lacunae]|uniref:Flagellar FliJ protein n=1 Tax=Parvibium lacunae TaxID=1888893 RepID=A0A368L597_9BURK|nr:flagellar export protein FliJ [Parvibium lacunae]RCS58320.1 flagellar export protein FliJ [Parvibium lacunae]